MTDSDKKPHGLWEVSLMLRLFPTELKNKNVILWPRPTSIIEICLEYVKAKQGRELLVSEVKGIFGDVEGIVIYLPKPLQNDMPITEWHALRLEV